MKRFSSLLVSFALFSTGGAAQESGWIAFESLEPDTQIEVEERATGQIRGEFERATADSLFLRVDGETMSVPRSDIRLVRTTPLSGNHAGDGAFWGLLLGPGVGAIFYRLTPENFSFEPTEQSVAGEYLAPIAVGVGLSVGVGALIGWALKWERGATRIYEDAGSAAIRISPIMTGQDRGIQVAFAF